VQLARTLKGEGVKSTLRVGVMLGVVLKLANVNVSVNGSSREFCGTVSTQAAAATCCCKCMTHRGRNNASIGKPDANFYATLKGPGAGPI
jgi:hypothetical protein